MEVFILIGVDKYEDGPHKFENLGVYTKEKLAMDAKSKFTWHEEFKIVKFKLDQ